MDIQSYIETLADIINESDDVILDEKKKKRGLYGPYVYDMHGDDEEGGGEESDGGDIGGCDCGGMMEEDEEKEKEDGKDDELTLKEYFQKAKRENKELQVRFVKVTDDKERTVVFSNSANVGADFKDEISVGAETLKKIERNHDRVYKKDVKYTGSLVTFPEKITEDTPNVTQSHDADDGTQWQWRRLYVQQIIWVKYDGKTVWENNELFDFNLAGRDGEETRTEKAEDFFKRQSEIESRKMKENNKEALNKVWNKKALEMAKKMKDEDAMVSIGIANGWSEKEDEVVKRRAISFKHEQLKRRNPSEHKMHETSPSGNRSGMHYVTCTCGFSYGYDTSD